MRPGTPGYSTYCNTKTAGRGGKYVDQQRQRQQRRNQANRNQRNQNGAQGNFDQEVGALGRTNEYNDLNNDFEIGGLTNDLDTGLNADFEIGELAQNYEFPTDAQRQQSIGRAQQQQQRTQRRKNDR